MKRCTTCILPESYPGITFDENGVCNQYRNHKELTYLGEEALKEEIYSILEQSKDRNKEYDCVLGISGGRDSTYLLYYLSEVLGLKVLAYSADHGFVPELTKMNMKRATNKLNMKLVIDEHHALKKSIKHTISSWMRSPSAPMSETFCTGCRIGIAKGILDFTHQHNIPIMVRGATPFELTREYKSAMLKLNPNGGMTSMMLGYLFNVAKNPGLFFNRTYVVNQYKEHHFASHGQALLNKYGIQKIRPFYTHVRWIEKDVNAIVENEMDWEKNPKTASIWRDDCYIAPLKWHIYKQAIGFNDKTVTLSHLVRDGQITREEALERLQVEEDAPEKVREEFITNLGLNYSDFKAAVSKMKKYY